MVRVASGAAGADTRVVAVEADVRVVDADQLDVVVAHPHDRARVVQVGPAALAQALDEAAHRQVGRRWIARSACLLVR